MVGVEYLNRIRDYCDYVEEHLLNVKKAWDEVQAKCHDMHPITDDFLWSMINEMIEEHDISKMDAEEFIPYQQQFYPVGDPPPKDSPAFKGAWEHHKQHNPHHIETWTQIKTEAYPNEKACHTVCMVCDWLAMSYKFGDTPRSFFEKNKHKMPELKEWESKFLYEIFDRLEATQ